VRLQEGRPLRYLWIKALHVFFVVAWYAGLFYLPRLFVYHAATTDAMGDARFKVMERRLYVLMTLAAVLAAGLGIALLLLETGLLRQGWLQAKLALVAALVVYHICCGRLLSAFRDGRNAHGALWYRWFNELPTLALLGIVVLVVVKPF
jgi:protoporphyrinogen IX oxidase